MLCIDTSSIIAYLEGAHGNDVDLVDQALSDQIGVFSPVTVTELLSDPHLQTRVRKVISGIPVLSIVDGFWERAGLLRAKVLRFGYKAKLADSLIAQNCIDCNVPLLTRDRDFKVFKQVSGLKVLSNPV